MAKQHGDRRSFLKGAAAAVAAGTLPLPLAELAAAPAETAAYKYPNPGRIVIVTDQGAVLGYNKVNEAVVQRMFDEGVMRFTGITSSPADALASLFPGLTKTSKIAIKPSLLNGTVPTRKELVKAVIARLVQMLGGFPATNITLYERHDMPSLGYTKAYFGQQVGILTDTAFPDLGYTILCDGKRRPYSKTLHDSDFLINMPVLKDHFCEMDFTLAFKNHMGTVNPGGPLGICSNKRAAMDIMADPVMVAKQKLVIMDCLYAVINGGPGGAPTVSPNTITIAQDPVTTDYQGRKMINEYRKAKAMAPKSGGYIEESSVAPYALGVANPAEMNIIPLQLSTGGAEASAPTDWTLSETYPNPFSAQAEWTLELPAQRQVRAEILSSTGELIQTLVDGARASGTTRLVWNPAGIAAGLYLLRVSVDGVAFTRKAMVLSAH
ncbi:MAG: DUF362 domain-containing protein [Ignavibacteria bacterium]|nr:DUF362 domain-containing protein [Ignavibacteria bacterium]